MNRAVAPQQRGAERAVQTPARQPGGQVATV